MNLQNLSIKGKLMLITMLTSSAALVLSSASFLIYDLISFRHLLTLDLMTQAQIIGYNSAAAMAFRDEAAATATLSALTAKEDIVAAVLYSPDGTIFAHYFPNGGAHPSTHGGGRRSRRLVRFRAACPVRPRRGGRRRDRSGRSDRPEMDRRPRSPSRRPA